MGNCIFCSVKIFLLHIFILFIRQFRFLEVHSGAINGCVLSSDGKYLASASEDRTIRIFTIRGGDGEFIQGPSNKELLGHTDAVNDVDFSTDGAALASASSDGKIMIWDSATGRLNT